MVFTILAGGGRSFSCHGLYRGCRRVSALAMRRQPQYYGTAASHSLWQHDLLRFHPIVWRNKNNRLTQYLICPTQPHNLKSWLEQHHLAALRDLKAELPHVFNRLNCKWLHLLPVNPSPTTPDTRMGRYGSPYATLDLTSIDPTLVEFDCEATGVDQFIELADETHRLGGYLMLDLVINHTGWEVICRNISQIIFENPMRANSKARRMGYSLGRSRRAAWRIRNCGSILLMRF